MGFELILETTMQYSLANWKDIAAELVPAWTSRSNSKTLLDMGPGCFIWNAKTDGIRATGMFYRRDMVRDYFGDEMGGGLETMIDAADLDKQVVVALIFDTKAIGACLAKSDRAELVECQPPVTN